LHVCEISNAFLHMKKIVLPFVAVLVCLASATATRASSATISSPIAALPLGDISARFLVQKGDKPTRPPSQARTLTFAERVTYQRAIEEVYWRHRIWPKERPDAKPPLDAVMTQAQLEKKVTDYVHKSQALEDYRHRSISADQLQAEMDRMAQHTKQPEVLRELFEALGNDPFVIAECLARPTLAERLLANSYAYDQSIRGELKQDAKADLQAHNSIEQMNELVGKYSKIEFVKSEKEKDRLTLAGDASQKQPLGSWLATAEDQAPAMIAAASAKYTLPNVSGGATCTDDTWTATTSANVPVGRLYHTAVWTGSEMIVWGGFLLNTGGRYNPSTDSWTATGLINAPTARAGHTAVWTGSEMIVWGGTDYGGQGFNTGGRYNPSTDSWTATSMTNAPAARFYHSAVWTGSEMIVWGGIGNSNNLNTGGRYDPSTDSWTATGTTGAPVARFDQTAVWTGSEMIVWGGYADFGNRVNTGGRYNPSTDSWIATSTTNAPAGRVWHTAVWTGSEMVVWGGNAVGIGRTNTGGRYCVGELPAQLGNISTRAFVQTGDHVLIGGFIVQGTEPKRVIIRAIGPELSQHGVPNALANPTLELHNATGALIASNDNWATTIIGGIITANQVGDIQASGYAPSDGRESAIIADLPPGNYTAIVRGVNNTTGVALAEVYDLGGGASSILGNISTRAFVQTGDNVMIGGFIVQGTQPKRVILRAIGPELAAPPFNIPDAMVNPTLELHDGTGALIASNDNWATTIIGEIITSNQFREIVNSGYAPADGRESAIIAELPPDNYTAIVRGVNNTTGVGLVEVYDLD
jgi:hypothetical protein